MIEVAHLYAHHRLIKEFANEPLLLLDVATVCHDGIDVNRADQLPDVKATFSDLYFWSEKVNACVFNRIDPVMEIDIITFDQARVRQDVPWTRDMIQLRFDMARQIWPQWKTLYKTKSKYTFSAKFDLNSSGRMSNLTVNEASEFPARSKSPEFIERKKQIESIMTTSAPFPTKKPCQIVIHFCTRP